MNMITKYQVGDGRRQRISAFLPLGSSGSSIALLSCVHVDLIIIHGVPPHLSLPVGYSVGKGNKSKVPEMNRTE